MNNLKFKLLIVVSCLLLVVSAADAANSIDLSVAGVGARPMGMGRAFTALSDDVNAVFSNPAGLGTQKAWGFTSMTTKLMDRVEYRMLGGTYPTDFGTFGVGYLSASTPAGYLTTDKASLSGAQAINYSSSMLILSYGRDLNEAIKNSGSIGKLSVGANFKAISNQFEGTDGSGTGSSADVGLIYKPNATVSTGLTFQNVGGTINWKSGTKEDMPLTTKLGGAVNLSKVALAADIENSSSSTLVHGGVEYRPFDGIALRAGIDQSALSRSESTFSYSGGVGVKMSGFSFDYAYRQDGTLASNSTHYFSISFQPEAVKTAVVQNEQSDDAITLSTTDGVYRLSRKSADKSILSYYQ